MSHGKLHVQFTQLSPPPKPSHLPRLCLVLLKLLPRPHCGGTLAVAHQPKRCAEVDHQLRRVELAHYAVLGGGIVERVLVVPVVPSLTDGHDCYESVLRRVGVGVVRAGAPQMRGLGGWGRLRVGLGWG